MIDLTEIKKRVTAIDPGMSGAVARLVKGKVEVRRDFKEKRDIARAVEALVPGADVVVIEAVHAMPGEGVCSVFTFAKSTGIAFGAVYSQHEPAPVEVAPQTWQNYFKKLLGIDRKTKFKTVTRDVAATIFFEQRDLFKRKKDHNTADACLLAAWGALNRTDKLEALPARRLTGRHVETLLAAPETALGSSHRSTLAARRALN